MRVPSPYLWIGAVVGVAAGVPLNLIPYYLSYQAYGTDGYEVIGYPFTFSREGGFAYSYHFYWSLLAADVVIFVVLGAAAGWTIKKVFASRTSPSVDKVFGTPTGLRGFPVMPATGKLGREQ